jgi:uncharacterized protein YegP (UPF0339 family)
MPDLRVFYLLIQFDNYATQPCRYVGSTYTSGQFYFTLKAANGETLGISEGYTTAASRDNGIEAVKRDAPNAPTEDLT